jgi:DNA-binding response OmpR family regulator
LTVSRRQTGDIDPLPVLLVRRGPVGVRALAALHRDPRLEVFPMEELTPEWISFSQRVVGTIVATEGDPLRALSWMVTAGFRGPIVMAINTRYRADIDDLMLAGAVACVTLPVSDDDVGKLVPVLLKHAALAHIDTTLRLLLDPIGRVARYRDKSVRLSQREFAVLHCLSIHRGLPVRADEVMQIVWGQTRSEERSRQILDVYVHQLRKKLGTVGLHGAIATIRGFGYALVQVTRERSTE